VLVNYKNGPNVNTTATFANLKINNKNCKVIIDSGAEATLVDSKVATQLGLTIQRDDQSPVRYVTANGEYLKTLGWSMIEVKIGSYKFRQKCVVIGNLCSNILLGTDVLVNHGIILNYHNKTLTVGNSTIELLTLGEQTSFCLSVSRRIEIRPLGSHVEWIHLPDNFKKSVLVQGEMLSHVKVTNGLFAVSEGKVPVLLINQKRHPVVIEKDQNLGYAERIKMVNVVKGSQQEKVVEKLNEKAIRAVELVQIDKRLTKEQLETVKGIIDKYDHVFAKDKDDLGFNDDMKFEINTGEEKPIKSRAYRVPYSQKDNVNSMIDEMLNNKIISKSFSAWASPIVIVKKKDGTDRFCVDYRKLNAITVKDNYPVPLIEETLDALRGSSYFTLLDLASGYWQMALDEKAKEKTAFISEKNLFQFEVLPFGLSNAVSFFQRSMENILDGLSNSKAYLDDVLTHSRNFEEHVIHLELVFKRLEEANLKVKPSKCLIASRETKFLGFDINIEGIRPCAEKFDAIKNYPAPTNQKKVKKFLGLASYYRKFIRNYSNIVDPINKLLKKGTKFIWSIECQESFEKIKEMLINPPILSFPDLNREFCLTTDASTSGLGAVLSQVMEDGIERVIGYASRSLSDAERNYSATELECLGVVWACNYFRHYLYGRKFTVWSDHNPLVYLDNAKNKHSKVTRWRLDLAEYNYVIKYKKGIKNTNADALSRMYDTDVEKTIQTKEINAVETRSFTKFKESMISSQNEDAKLKTIIEGLKEGKKVPNYVLKDGLLYRSSNVKDCLRIVIPESGIEQVFMMCHDDMGGGHLGFKKTWPKVRDRFYWKTMYRDTYLWVKSCTPCAKRKSPEPARSNLKPINVAEEPWDMAGVDILGPLRETVNGNKYIVVFTDYLTRWPEAFAIKNREAKTIAKVFVNEIVSRHSAPKILLSDQGAEFMSNMVDSICEYLVVKKINTTAYHPACNGLTERMNATLCQILSNYTEENQTDWDEFIQIALFAYRSSIQETTLMTPFELLYNRQPRLPNDLESLRIKEPMTLDLKLKWLGAKKRIQKVNDTRKAKYDAKFKERKIEVGDNVRMEKLATKPGLKFKMRNDIWNGPFKVIGKLPNGDYKIDIGLKFRKPYIVHPDRLKLAEGNFKETSMRLKENEKERENKSKKTLKKVTFKKDLFSVIKF
jgi:hypothetical protein